MLAIDEPFLRLFNQGVILGQDHEKMSKSRGNVVNPDDVVGQVGADAVRCFLMFIGPWDQGGPWSDEGINGIVRWLNRVWNLAEHDAGQLDAQPTGPAAVRDTRRILHRTIRKCYEDLDRFKFNTAISALMSLTNHLSQAWNDQSIDAATWQDCIRNFLLMLAPIAPHVAEELWQRRGQPYSIHQQAFPQWDDALAAADGNHPGTASQRPGARPAECRRRHHRGGCQRAGAEQPAGAGAYRRQDGAECGVCAGPGWLMW